MKTNIFILNQLKHDFITEQKKMKKKERKVHKKANFYTTRVMMNLLLKNKIKLNMIKNVTQ